MGRQIGPYEIVEELGRGGMGIVFKAREEALQRFVAIKMLGNQLTENDSVVQRFMREARAVADVNHPNLVQVYRVDKHDGQPYFVMEYVEGESLKSLIERERRMQPMRALQILKEVAAGLAAAHDKGVVHRDIKPENVMLTRYGGVKVVDFGIARVDEPGTRLTTTGIGLGTPSYLSPEVCLSQDVDARSDIFSLGVVLFEMLTGDIPFKSDSPFELMTKVVEAKIPDIKALNPNVDDGVRQILAKMIAKRPKLRYQNCNELISDIEDYRAGRVPRWARDMPLDAAAPAAVSAEPAGQPGDRPAEDETPAADARTTPMPTPDPDPAAPATGAQRTAGATEAVATGAARPRRRRGWIAVAALLLVVAGGTGATWLMLADTGPWTAWFDTGADDEVALRTADTAPRPRVDAFDSPGSPAAEEAASLAVSDGEPEPEAPTTAAADAAAASAPGDAGSTAPGAGFELARSDEDAVGDEASGDPAATSADADRAGTRDEAQEAATPPPSAGPADGIAAVRTAPRTAAAERMPASPRVAVIAVGDPAVAGPVARILKRSLGRASFEVVDEQLLDGLVYAESLAGIARSARDGGIDVLVYADVVPTGERELQFYGRSELQQLATLEVRIVDLHDQRNLGRPVVRDIEYVALTAGREARQIAQPVARNVVNRLRALRAMRGEARPG
jgi:serine/threonine-protein kinase